MKEWYSPAEIGSLALPGLPANRNALNKYLDREGWRERLNMAQAPLAKRRKGNGGGWEYHYSLFPRMAQAKLIKDSAPAAAPTTKEVKVELGRGDAWAFYESLPDTKKQKANKRYAILEAVSALQRGGETKDLAVFEASNQNGVSSSTIYNWLKLVAGKSKADWLPALAPHHSGRPREVECSPEAWEMLKSDYLRAERPSFEACYRRAKRAAVEQGWSVPPSRTMLRRMNNEISHAVQTLARHGADAVKQLYPAQERDRSVFHALEAINADGHKWDVWVEWPDGEILRPCMTAIQDVYSGMFLSWRIDKSENQEAFRLSFGDMVEEFGIPEIAYLDNGRNFASKWMTGGTPNRYRFKIRDDDPVGILTSLGVDIHWTTPYSGQSKPIERGFRDFCDNIAKHPAIAGTWSGNTPLNKPENYRSKAVKLEDFIAVVEDGIIEHNTRTDRRTKVCQGRSFQQAFAESYAKSPIQKATEEQRRLWLLAAEGVRASNKDGTLSHMKNRYWGEFLNDFMGQKLVVRFDPQNLHLGLHVYRLDGSYLGFADVIEATGFNDVNAARDHGRKRKAMIKGWKMALEAERSLSPDQVAAHIPAMGEAPQMEAKVVKMFGADASLMAKPKAVEQKLSKEEIDAAQSVYDTLENGADNITVLPITKSSENPVFETDEQFIRWVQENPDRVNDDQKSHAEYLLETSPSLRLLIEGDAVNDGAMNA